MTQARTLFALLGFSAFAFASCNQDDGNTVTPDPDPSTPATCRLTSLTSPDYTFTVSYDGSKRISEQTLTYDSTTRITYSYASDYHTRTGYYNGRLLGRDTVRLNSAGYVASVTAIRLTGSDSGKTQSMRYEYNSGNKISKVINIASPTQSYVIFQYDYDANGNIAKFSTNAGFEWTYEYYTDKAMRTGDAMMNQFLMDGDDKMLNNAHLLKSSTHDGVTTSYVYSFDSQGRISSYTEQEGADAPKTVTVKQSCD